MNLEIDLDGVMTVGPAFFSNWIHSSPDKVLVITCCRDDPNAIGDLEKRNIL